MPARGGQNLNQSSWIQSLWSKEKGTHDSAQMFPLIIATLECLLAKKLRDDSASSLTPGV